MMDFKEDLSPFEKLVGQKAQAYNPGGCLPPEELLELAERGRRSRNYEARMNHVAVCPVCSAILESLKKAEVLYKGAKYSPDWIQRIAQWSLSIKNDTPYEGPHWLPKWSMSYLEWIGQSTIPIPTYRSAAAPPAPPVRLLIPNPGNRALMSTVTSFEWQPVKDASAYDVRLEVASARLEDGFQGIPSALNVEGTTARLNSPVQLMPGSLYRLCIRSRFTAASPFPSKQETRYVFKVLSKKQQQHAKWAFKNRQEIPITSAIILYQLEFYADAAAIAKEHLTKKEHEPLIQAILQALAYRIADPGELDA